MRRRFESLSRNVLFPFDSTIETVAQPAHVLQVDGRCGIILNLAPQIEDVVVHHAFADVGCFAPYGREQLSPAKYPSAAFHEAFQQFELDRRQLNRGAAFPQFAAVEIQFAIAEAEHLPAREISRRGPP
jgi:hypothetical protein